MREQDMSTIAHRTHPLNSNSFRAIIMLSAWGFALVIASCLFLWLGYLLDELLGTAPKFMLALFVLAIIGGFIEIYQEAMSFIKHA
jgi:F0F1-type ATP synthase assembly protein I